MWVGFELTVYGMGLVFLLLAVLWGLIAMLLRFDTPEAVVEATEPLAGAGAPVPDGRTAMLAGDAAGLEPELLAAVVIACRAHRMARRKQAAPEMRTHVPGSLPSRWIGTGRTRQNRSWSRRGRLA
ncbi:MAG: sodium pump decarboxylase subunit gamma [Acidobacteria bacterium]|nr:MAG: sodium pump decarboxylase subunit gamma [Acidobacteriota bacterium]